MLTTRSRTDRRTPRRTTGPLALALTAAVLAGCANAESDAPAAAKSTRGTEVRLPPANAAFDYQLGGPYPPPPKVRVVSRDRTAEPVFGLYNICYVNAFQSQPGDAVDWWRRHHPDLLLRRDNGRLVIDEDWKEPLLDISTPQRRKALMRIVGPWIDGCADAGFDAVEPDNLDSYARSDGLLEPAHAVAFARLLSDRAHARGLAVAQKNTTELLGQRRRTGFDFAVAEECARYKECGDYAKAYANRVFDIEYNAKDFTVGCRTWGKRLSVTLRDLDVGPAGTTSHVYRHC